MAKKGLDKKTDNLSLPISHLSVYNQNIIVIILKSEKTFSSLFLNREEFSV